MIPANVNDHADVLILAWVPTLLRHISSPPNAIADNVKATNIVYDILFLYQGKAGAGRHLWDIKAADAIRLSQVNLPWLLSNANQVYTDLDQLSWILSMLYGPTIWLAKAALLLQLMQIFAPNKSGFVYWAIHVLIWEICSFILALSLLSFLNAFPRQRYGIHSIKEAIALTSTLRLPPQDLSMFYLTF